MLRRPPRSTLDRSSAASDVYKRQGHGQAQGVRAGDDQHRHHALDDVQVPAARHSPRPVSYTHLRAHETVLDLVCRLLLEKKKTHTLTSSRQTMNIAYYLATQSIKES